MVILSRRHSRGGRSKKIKEEKISYNTNYRAENGNNENIDKDSCYTILCAEKSRSIKDRVLFRKFFVAKSYDTEVVHTSDSYIDAIQHCPVDFMIFDSDGIKVYPTPSRKTTSGHEYVIRKNRFDKVLSSHRELQEAINHCPNGYYVYDSDDHKVY